MFRGIEERLLSRAEVAVLLGVSQATVVRMESRGELEARRVGRRSVRITADSVTAYLSRKGGVA